MFSAKVMLRCTGFNAARFSTTLKNAFTPKLRSFGTAKNQPTFARVRTDVKSPSLKDRLMAPAGDSAFVAGKAVVAGASLVGLGALCFYGLGLSNELGAMDKAVLWPEVVKERIRSTYAHFGGGLFFTGAAAFVVSKSPVLMELMMRSSFLALCGSLVAMMGTGYFCMSLPYQEGLGIKQLAWGIHACTVGCVLAPLTLFGGPLVLRAAFYTAGVIGGLSTLAMCAPSEKFLNLGGPLAMGFGFVFASCIGSLFVPPTTVLGAGMYSVVLYGGLALFGVFLLYDTQKAVKKAENYPTYSVVPFDPINNSIGIYADTVNIFIRILIMLGSGGNRRK